MPIRVSRGAQAGTGLVEPGGGRIVLGSEAFEEAFGLGGHIKGVVETTRENLGAAAQAGLFTMSLTSPLALARTT